MKSKSVANILLKMSLLLRFLSWKLARIEFEKRCRQKVPETQVSHRRLSERVTI